MKHTDVENALKDLQNISVQLPLHQSRLRERLMQQHASRTPAQRCFFANLLWSVRARVSISKRQLSMGVAFAALIITLLGLLFLLPDSNNPAGPKLIAQPNNTSPAVQPLTEHNAGCTTPSCLDTKSDTAAPAGTALSGPSITLGSPVLDSSKQAQIAYVTPGTGATETRTIPTSTVTTTVGSAGESNSSVNVSVTIDTTVVADVSFKNKAKKEKPAKENKTTKDKSAR